MGATQLAANVAGAMPVRGLRQSFNIAASVFRAISPGR
jgi:hypothetical protein